jgi:hypothetical protein
MRLSSIEVGFHFLDEIRMLDGIWIILPSAYMRHTRCFGSGLVLERFGWLDGKKTEP